jgi:hypothetical protein
MSNPTDKPELVDVTLRLGPEGTRLHRQVGNEGFQLIWAAALMLSESERLAGTRLDRKSWEFLFLAHLLNDLVLDLMTAKGWVVLYAAVLEDSMSFADAMKKVGV